MYLVKVGILYQRNFDDKDPNSYRGRYWTTWWENWEEEFEIEMLLEMIKRDKQKLLEESQVSDAICHVICLETAPEPEGIFVCGSCDFTFDKFDVEVGDNCCPHCKSEKFLEGCTDD
jgi:hypothetical protein